jgi:plastocyanin
MRVDLALVSVAVAAALAGACGGSSGMSQAPGITGVGSGGSGGGSGGGSMGGSGGHNTTITASSVTTGGVYGSGGNYFFSPTPDTVAAGTVVTFQFGSVAHNVVFAASPNAPANIPASMNTSVDRTFSAAGTYNYMCTIHGFSGVLAVH